MRFALSTEQIEFSRSIDSLLTDADTPAAIRSWAEGEHGAGLALWRGLSDLGVTALAVPESHDGLGADAVDLAVAIEPLGYHAVPGPVAESVAAVPALLTAMTGREAPEKWLPGLARGESIGTLATEPDVPYALDADVADIRLCITGDKLYEFGRAEAPLSSMDPARRLFTVQRSSLAEIGRGEHAGQRAQLYGTLAAAAQLLGAGQRLLDASVDYAKQRVQYGKPIGQYQAIKHLLADVATHLELARPLVHGAAVALAFDHDTAQRDTSAARVATADAAYLAARTALQVHGAIGYTSEHDIGLWVTKVRALQTAWGTQAVHRARVLDAVTTGAGVVSW